MKLTTLWKMLALPPWLSADDKARPKPRRTRVPAVQPLEERRLLSITPTASYRDEQNVTLVVGTDYGLLAGAAGQNLSATLVDQPAHGSIQMHADGSFQYTPSPGFSGKDHFKFRESPDDPRLHIATIDVMTPAVWAKQPKPAAGATPGKGGIGVSPLNEVSDQGESLSDSDVTGEGGTPFNFVVSVAGVWPYTMVNVSTQDDTTTPLKDHQERAHGQGDYVNTGVGYTVLGTSATFDFPVTTYNFPGDKPDTTSKIFDVVATVQDQHQPWGQLEADALGTIKIHDPQPCMCFCGCDPVDAPAKVDPPNGNLQLKTGPSNDAPGKMQLAQVNEPHPIFSADDTLSATVASATSITAQLTLTDAAGNTVYTGTPIYYSAAGATPGEVVRFAQQIDAGALASGAYQWNIAVTENYAAGSPVMRDYGGIKTIENLDNSPYGRGWLPANLDSLVIQTNGAS
ncbi:MAG TPA: Ig-like domain-containing protein, partial [Pirellulales bacterium]